MTREELICKISAYQPANEQEEQDKPNILRYLKEHSGCLCREDRIAHFTASVWAVNRERTKTLMVYHKIYDSWSWIGGHADGETDLAAVAMRELEEETGVTGARLVSQDIFSLEILTVMGHEKRGQYVPGHLHMNVTFLAEADEEETLRMQEEENSGVRWCTLEEVLTLPKEPWMVERIYKKLVARVRDNVCQNEEKRV